MDMRAIMIDWSKFDLWSVWIFLSMEKPLSESAFKEGIDSNPYHSLHNKPNLSCPSRVFILPTLLQKRPTLGLTVSSAALYSLTEGWSHGDRVNSLSWSIEASSANPSCRNCSANIEFCPLNKMLFFLSEVSLSNSRVSHQKHFCWW